jgi:FkbM family methyltransferase
MLRHLLRKFIRAIGFDGMDVRRFDRLAEAELAGTTHHRLLPHVFARALPASGPAYLMQIGANDGASHDSFAFMHGHPQVHSALVEPQPSCLAALGRLCAGNPRMQIIPHALSAADGTLTLHRFLGETENGRDLSLFTSFDRHHLEHMSRYYQLKTPIAAEQVPASTLASLLARSGFPRLDVLLCDIEGLDHLAVMQGLALSHLPRLIIFEHYWLTPELRKQCYELLDRHGYAVIHGTHDTICLLETKPAAA